MCEIDEREGWELQMLGYLSSLLLASRPLGMPLDDLLKYSDDNEYHSNDSVRA